MDEEEKRALFRGLNVHRAPASASASSESSIGSSIPSRPSSPPPPNPPSPRSEASSDASTVQPPTPPPQQQPQPPAPPSPTPSSSTASTVPPPSPAAVQRVLSTIPASSTHHPTSRPGPVIVSVEDTDIEQWDAQRDAERQQKALARAALAADYPQLSLSNFRFATDGPQPPDHQLSDSPRVPDGNFGVLPGSIARFLSEYQRDGVTFMYRLFERGRGGLLADAMGLGKTVQTVVFLGVAFSIWDRAQRERINEAPTTCKGDAAPMPAAPRILVVVPTSVRDNWRNEFSVWTPFRVELYDRSEEPSLRRRLRNGGVEVLIAGFNPVATYGASFFTRPCGGRNKWVWDVVIVDEIHVARNDQTHIHAALKALPKRVMFGLTGTAVQNKLGDLWNVMSLVVPQNLWPGKSRFRRDFIDVINKGTKRDASVHMRKKAGERIARLRKLLAKHLVRRPKSIINDQLPGKTDYCVLLRMKRNGLQGYMYQRFQNSYDVKLLRDAKMPCDCGSMDMSKECCHRYPANKRNLDNAPIWKMHHEDLLPCKKCPNCICLYLQHFSRSLAAHALLLMSEGDETDQRKAQHRKNLFQYYLGEHAERTRGPLVRLEQEADVSCKLNVALKLLKSFEQCGHKTIIFYESLRLGAILQRWATNKGLVYEVIDGSVNKGDRQGAVDRFNTNSVCSIFFISKKAGGTGLNICGADRVLIFEPCWNPTLDLQAGDRAHRLGQKRVVQIIRLVVENTIEHYVFKTAITKSQISSAILDNTKEEWRVREDEVGSMHAMLRMGDIFSTREESQEEDYRMIEAANLGELSGAPNGLVKEDKTENELDLFPNHIRESSADDMDVFGDEVMCSLDVDIKDDAEDADESPWEMSENEDEREEVVEEKEKVVQEKENVAARMPDSQMEVDMVLCDAGASGKLVMSSTSARKKKQQLMGVNATQRSSGINPGGAEGVDFDDAAWKDISLSQESDEAGIEKNIVDFKREKQRQDQRRTLRSAVERHSRHLGREDADQKILRQQRKPKRRDSLQNEKIAKRRKAAPTAKSTRAKRPSKPEEAPAPVKSAFAARARVRR